MSSESALRAMLVAGGHDAVEIEGLVALRRYGQAGGRVALVLDGQEAFAIIGTLQLALRHPTIGEAVGAVTRSVIGRMSEQLPDELRPVIERGYQPAFDFEEDGTPVTDVRSPWRCQRCGSPRWVSASLTGPVSLGGRAVRQCVPCGYYSDDPVPDVPAPAPSEAPERTTAGDVVSVPAPEPDGPAPDMPTASPPAEGNTQDG
jgi:hypothetical protein